MAVTPLGNAEIFSMLSKLKFGKIGNGKVEHMSKGGKTALCGKFIDVFLEIPRNTDAPVCKRCYSVAEKNYRMDRKISYGCMRDAELDRMTYGGEPFTEAEEKRAISEYMEYAGRTTDADIAILTADGFVECTPEILAEALTELAEPRTIMSNKDVIAYDEWSKTGIHSIPDALYNCEADITDHEGISPGDVEQDTRSAYERVVSPDGIDGPMSGQYDDYDYAAEMCIHEELKNYCTECQHAYELEAFEPNRDAEFEADQYNRNDGMDAEDNINAPLMVDALMSVHADGITVPLGWQLITVPFGSEKSLATLYAEQSGSTWHRVGAPKWDSVITVLESTVR